MTERLVAEETMHGAAAERDISPGDSPRGAKRRETAPTSKNMKGIEEKYWGKFSEKATFRLLTNQLGAAKWTCCQYPSWASLTSPLVGCHMADGTLRGAPVSLFIHF
jgi:hypothetical protein